MKTKDSMIETFDPATGKPLKSYQIHSQEEILEKLSGAQAAQLAWRGVPAAERARKMRALARILRRDSEKLAALIGAEMGKVAKESRAEIEKCAACADYYAENGPGFLQPKIVPSDAEESFVSFEPLGTVLAIMPWNFPFWQALRCAIPALVAGNAVALKHASNVTGCALEIERVLHEALETHREAFCALLLPGGRALELIDRKEISAISFTGSTEVGRKIAERAGAKLKKCVLELGGSDAYLILADADIERAAGICAHSRLLNSGQSCISAKRFIVERQVLREFTEKLVEKMKLSEIAPLARKDLRADLHLQVTRSLEAGAKLLCGGKFREEGGWHYPPTVIAGVKPGMPAFDEETFGPVAAIIEASDREEAVRLANLVPFGLGGAVFSADIPLAREIARSGLEAGNCFVNDFVRSDPRLPFGGVKDSGYGRELSEFGIREFMNIKTVWVRAN